MNNNNNDEVEDWRQYVPNYGEYDTEEHWREEVVKIQKQIWAAMATIKRMIGLNPSRSFKAASISGHVLDKITGMVNAYDVKLQADITRELSQLSKGELKSLHAISQKLLSLCNYVVGLSEADDSGDFDALMSVGFIHKLVEATSFNNCHNDYAKHMRSCIGLLRRK